MTRAFVADASVAIGWVHPAQATAHTDAMLDAVAQGASIEVPALWPLEVASALAVLVRRRKLSEDERQTGLVWLRGLPLRVDHEMASLAFSRLSELASTYQLSVYDAAYLELAQRRKLVLGCQDGPLRKAARQSGVSRTTMLTALRRSLSLNEEAVHRPQPATSVTVDSPNWIVVPGTSSLFCRL